MEYLNRTSENVPHFNRTKFQMQIEKNKTEQNRRQTEQK